MGVIHLSHPKRSLWVFMHKFEQVDEPLACNTREHSDGLPWKSCRGHFLDEVQQDPVLDSFPKEVGLVEGYGPLMTEILTSMDICIMSLYSMGPP